jgi:hypothetical protein
MAKKEDNENVLEQKVAALENWVGQQEGENGPRGLLENYTFLINQLRGIGDRLRQVEQSHVQLEQALAQNNEALRSFLDEKDLVIDWQDHVAKLTSGEGEDAVEEGKESEDN